MSDFNCYHRDDHCEGPHTCAVHESLDAAKGREWDALYTALHALDDRTRERDRLRAELAEARGLLAGVLDRIRTSHLDMGGKHHYAMRNPAYTEVEAARAFLDRTEPAPACHPKCEFEFTGFHTPACHALEK